MSEPASHNVTRFPGAPAGAVSPGAVGGVDDELVDEIVKRIEQRVIDELERRGRTSYPGAF